MAAPRVFDAASPLQFVVNAASGGADVRTKLAAIDVVLGEGPRRGTVAVCDPAELPAAAEQAARQAAATGGAIVAVGGDGTINTVARAAHAASCAMGIVPHGTFNYFARTHGIPEHPLRAVTALLHARPVPVRVASVNGHLFLVNASLGLYPDLLQDREAYKARFGRNRWVAFGAGMLTLLRAQRTLRLQLAAGALRREVRTLTLFVGNNPLQLAQLGLPADTNAQTEAGRITAVVLRPVGMLEMIGLMVRGAMGALGEAPGVANFRCTQLTVRPSTLGLARRRIKLALDGEVVRMQAPLDFRVHDAPLHLLVPGPQPGPRDGETDGGA